MLQGVVGRLGVSLMNLIGRKSQTLDLLVENMGHVNFGNQINENRKVSTSNQASMTFQHQLFVSSF